MPRLRVFLLWFLMIAVPFQGAAAATMAFCGMATEAPAAMQMQAASPHDHSAHQQQAHHDHAAQPEEAAAQPTGHAHADSFHKCANCAACHGVALTSASPLAQVHALPPADLAEPATALATQAPRVPDKPPRA